MISYRSRHIRPYIWTLSKVFYCVMTSYLILHCDWHGEIRAHKKHYYLSGKKLKSGNIAVEWEPVPWAGVGSGALQICLCCAGLRLWAMQCLWLWASELSHRECQNASLAIVSMIKVTRYHLKNFKNVSIYSFFLFLSYVSFFRKL